MAAYYLIRNNTVENIVEWDGVSPYNPGPGYSMKLVSGGLKGAVLPPPPAPINTPDLMATMATDLALIRLKVGA